YILAFQIQLTRSFRYASTKNIVVSASCILARYARFRGEYRPVVHAGRYSHFARQTASGGSAVCAPGSFRHRGFLLFTGTALANAARCKRFVLEYFPYGKHQLSAKHCFSVARRGRCPSYFDRSLQKQTSSLAVRGTLNVCYRPHNGYCVGGLPTWDCPA